MPIHQAPERLIEIHGTDAPRRVDAILGALRDDNLALLKGIAPNYADELMELVAQQLSLREELELQASAASTQGHRERIGKYFMTVNKRSDYRFIPSHSEGTRTSGFQLAAFYCYENSTDGGTTIFLSPDQDSASWSDLYETVHRIDTCGKTLSAKEAFYAKLKYGILPGELIRADEKSLLDFTDPLLPGIRILRVLASVEKSFSKILKREVSVYWDSVGSTDFASGEWYTLLLKNMGLLKSPKECPTLSVLDNAYSRRCWRSRTSFSQLFGGMLARKLDPGELVILNNMTWTHSASNWTPTSGTRKVAAAFA